MVLINRRIGFDVVCNPAPASPCPTCPLLAGRRTRADHLATTCRLSFVGPRLACGLHSSARAPAQEDDHYATLEVPETIDAAGLKRKFYALSKQLHPDRNPGDEAATSRFQAVSAAYSILSDPRTRYVRRIVSRAATDSTRAQTRIRWEAEAIGHVATSSTQRLVL